MDLKFPTKIQSPAISPRGFGVKATGLQARGFLRHSKKLVFISIVCFILTGAVYGGGFIWYQSLNNQKSQLEKTIKELSEQITIDKELEEEMVATVEGIQILKDLLNTHVIASRLFKLIEDNTSVKVQWSSLDFSSPQLVGQNIESGGLGSLALQGVTQTYLLAGRQLRVFENMSEVKSVKLSGLSQTEQGVNFSLDIELEPDLFLLELE